MTRKQFERYSCRYPFLKELAFWNTSNYKSVDFESTPASVDAFEQEIFLMSDKQCWARLEGKQTRLVAIKSSTGGILAGAVCNYLCDMSGLKYVVLKRLVYKPHAGRRWQVVVYHPPPLGLDWEDFFRLVICRTYHSWLQRSFDFMGE